MALGGYNADNPPAAECFADDAAGGSEGNDKAPASPHQTQHLSHVEDLSLDNIWLEADRPKALFLDYDGTLREFEDRPELAVPTEQIHALLAALNDRRDLAVHIVSGRDAQFLRESFSRYRRITLCAEHELQARGRFHICQAGSATADDRQMSGSTSPPSPNRRDNIFKQAARSEMERIVEATPGSHLEEKTSSLVWHYRGVSDATLAVAAATELVDGLEGLGERHEIKDFGVTHGHKIVELSFRPDVTKGGMLTKIATDRRRRGEQPFAATLVAGDDVSDESMFEAAPSDAVTIKVGRDPTLARFSVDSPDHLRRLLWRLVAKRDCAT